MTSPVIRRDGATYPFAARTGIVIAASILLYLAAVGAEVVIGGRPLGEAFLGGGPILAGLAALVQCTLLMWWFSRRESDSSTTI